MERYTEIISQQDILHSLQLLGRSCNRIVGHGPPLSSVVVIVVMGEVRRVTAEAVKACRSCAVDIRR